MHLAINPIPTLLNVTPWLSVMVSSEQSALLDHAEMPLMMSLGLVTRKAGSEMACPQTNRLFKWNNCSFYVMSLLDGIRCIICSTGFTKWEWYVFPTLFTHVMNGCNNRPWTTFWPFQTILILRGIKLPLANGQLCETLSLSWVSVARRMCYSFM